MVYKCDPCNYETDFHSNYARHIKSSKHTKCIEDADAEDNEEGKYICTDCSKEYVYKSGLSRHKMTCTKRKITKLETEINDLKLKMLSNEIDSLKTQLETSKQDKNDFKKLAESATKTNENSVSALKYVIDNYANAPPIQVFQNFNILLEGNEDYTVPEILLHYYKKGRLIKYIGDRLIKKYRKENPAEQSVWNSDISRFSYLMKEAINNSNKNTNGWGRDKKGVKVTKYIIAPLLEYSKEQAKQYAEELAEELNDGCDNPGDTTTDITRLHEIVDDIDNEKLHTEIMKYMAPKLQLRQKQIKIKTK